MKKSQRNIMDMDNPAIWPMLIMDENGEPSFMFAIDETLDNVIEGFREVKGHELAIIPLPLISLEMIKEYVEVMALRGHPIHLALKMKSRTKRFNGNESIN